MLQTEFLTLLGGQTLLLMSRSQRKTTVAQNRLSVVFEILRRTSTASGISDLAAFLGGSEDTLHRARLLVEDYVGYFDDSDSRGDRFLWFHDLLGSRSFVDYSNAGQALAGDRETEKQRLDGGDTVVRVDQQRTDLEYPLPHPSQVSIWDESDLVRVGLVLYASFYALERRSFFDLYEVFLTPTPSNGARNPLYCEIYLPETLGNARWFRYNPLAHAVSPLEGDRPCPPSQGPLLLIHADFEVEQWRYRHSWYYSVVLLEVGHKLGAIQTAAELASFVVVRRTDLEGWFLQKERCLPSLMSVVELRPQQE